MKNWNSIKNQSIKSKFVGREVLYCQTSLVEDMLKAGNDGNRDFPSIDDLPNMFHYGEIFGETYYTEEEIEERIEEIQNLFDELQSSREEEMIESFANAYDIESYITDCEESMSEEEVNKWAALAKELEALEEAKGNGPEEFAEVYEWWLVTGWFADKLKSHNEVILEWNGCQWWGRQTTGQAILLDYVISRICEEMEILEGQVNEWNV